MIKTSNKFGIEGNYHNLIKSIYKNHTLNIKLNGERLMSLSNGERSKDVHSSLLLSLVLEVLGTAEM